MPTITKQPTSQTVAAGVDVTFSVAATATGGGTLGFRWQKDGIDLAGATTNTLIVSNVNNSHEGVYTVVVTESGGSSRTSDPATLTVVATFAELVTLFAGIADEIREHGAPTGTLPPLSKEAEDAVAVGNQIIGGLGRLPS